MAAGCSRKLLLPALLSLLLLLGLAYHHLPAPSSLLPARSSYTAWIGVGLRYNQAAPPRAPIPPSPAPARASLLPANVSTHAPALNTTPDRRAECEVWTGRGRVPVNSRPALLSPLPALPGLEPGGEVMPPHCRPRQQVAIIVPYRDRPDQLAAFLHHLHPFLARQLLHYRIYLVTQADTNPFNRGQLLNVGAVEAGKDRAWDCFIFHDVDLLPEDDRNLYRYIVREPQVDLDKLCYYY